MLNEAVSKAKDKEGTYTVSKEDLILLIPVFTAEAPLPTVAFNA